jgi:predicted nucleic acid-binding protein
VSEPTKSRPDPAVCAWLNTIDPNIQFISVVTIGEIRFGVERLPVGPSKRRLEAWLERLKLMFAGRILPVELAVAERWGRLRQEVGRSLSVADALIGASALVHGLRVATRNEWDFKDFGLDVVNPWRT